MHIYSLGQAHREQVNAHVRDEWGGPMIVTMGNLYDSSNLPGFVAVDDGDLAGAILYQIEGDECEIAVVFSLMEGKGVGRALLDAVINLARDTGLRRAWLVTTNDNTHAIRFYQKYGLALKAVHIGAIEISRKLKNELPEKGIDGIPIEHEFEFELLL